MPAKTPSADPKTPQPPKADADPAADAEAVEAAEAPPSEAESEADAPARSRKRSRNRRPDLSDTVPAIPVAAFRRLVREISQDHGSDLRWESDALEALQVDAEAFLIQRFDEANQRRRLAKVKTLDQRHFVANVLA
jgi:histone H3/H4